MPTESTEISQIIQAWGEGDASALDRLIPIVYDRLRDLARLRLRSAPGATLDTTGLVHEVYLKLASAPEMRLRDRAHFLAVVSRVMRNLLTDHARARQALKRGGGAVITALDTEPAWMPEADLDAVVALDEALVRLDSVAPRQTRILEQRYFGGLSLEETAEALGVSLATVKRELRSACAWLAAELSGERVL